MPDIDQSLGADGPSAVPGRFTWVQEGADDAAYASVDFLRGAAHAAFEAPCNGAVQLINAGLEPAANAKLPRLNLTGIEEGLANGTANVSAVQAGAVLGSVAPMYALSKCRFGKSGLTMSAARTSEFLGTRSVASMGGTTARAFAVGGAYGAVLTESQNENDILGDRLANGIKTGFSFAAFNAASELGRGALSRNQMLGTANTSRFLSTELPAATLISGVSGAGVGVLSANVDTLIDEGRFATTQEMQKRAAAEFLFGAAFGALHQTHSHFAKPGNLQAGDHAQIDFARQESVQNPALQRFYARNQHPDLKHPTSFFSDDSRVINYNHDTWVVYHNAMAPATASVKDFAHVTIAPNGRPLGASIDRMIKHRDAHFRTIVGQDVFAPEVQGFGLVDAHTAAANAALRSHMGPANYFGRVVVRPEPGATPMDPLSAEIRLSYHNLGATKICSDTMPLPIQFGDKVSPNRPMGELIVTPMKRPGEAPERWLYERVALHVFNDVKIIAHQVNPNHAQIDYDWGKVNLDKLARKSNLLPLADSVPAVQQSKLQQFQDSRLGAWLNNTEHRFAASTWGVSRPEAAESRSGN